MIQMGTKKRTRQEPRRLQWDWAEDLYLSQEKKLNHTLLSFEAASPQIYSCLLLLNHESLFQILGTQSLFSLGNVVTLHIRSGNNLITMVKAAAGTHSQPPHHSRGPEAVKGFMPRT